MLFRSPKSCTCGCHDYCRGYWDDDVALGAGGVDGGDNRRDDFGQHSKEADGGSSYPGANLGYRPGMVCDYRPDVVILLVQIM